ncbi:thiamine diphosphokinase [Segatella bryantii]|jgi:thiamine pyrophosphokinase|uniref:thiamine diphosphokinase n=1 Tax=Segatella bryantii TaxID=77095 RepID=UPI00241F6190|nr:thiamine diphosphokinase [Segatella bryantii]
MIFPLITESYHPEAVIIAGGDYPTHPIPLALLRHAKFVCCCDGTAQTYIEHGYIPHAIVGDGDSLTEEFKIKYQSIFHHISEQEDNDLTKATRYCMAKGYTSICYLGATGKREDHTLGNISLLIRYMHAFHIQATMVTDHGYFTPAEGKNQFESFRGQQISIFNFGCTTLYSEGCKWNTYAFDELWQGTLNEAIGDTITFEGNGKYLVYRTFNSK